MGCYKEKPGIGMIAKEELAQKIKEIDWHHTFHLDHGLVTQGGDNSPKKLKRLQCIRTIPSLWPLLIKSVLHIILRLVTLSGRGELLLIWTFNSVICTLLYTFSIYLVYASTPSKV